MVVIGSKAPLKRGRRRPQADVNKEALNLEKKKKPENVLRVFRGINDT